MSDPPIWRIELLRQTHIRDSFNCGEPALDEFLRKYARQNQERDICRTYVAIRIADARPVVWGYYAISANAIEASGLPSPLVRRFPRYPLPVVHLGRLAVDRRVQGQGLGHALLADALKKTVLASDLVGVFAVEVLAKTPEARRFYEKAGFAAIPDDPLHLILPLATVRKLLQ